MTDMADATCHDEQTMSPNPLPNSKAGSRAVIPFPNACEPAPAVPIALDEDERARLEAARWWLIKSRLTARAVIDEACFLLAHAIPCETSAFGIAFFRLLDLHAKRDLQCFAIGIEAITHDERWLLQMLRAGMDKDEGTVSELVGWRVAKPAHRRAQFLVMQLGKLLREGDPMSIESVHI